MNILIASSEVVPFAKTGGLADVCGALPLQLAGLSHQVAVILPAYRRAVTAGLPIHPAGIGVDVPIGNKTVHGRILRSNLPGSDVPVFLVEQDDYFDRPELYGESGEDYPDNCERFVFFCRAVMQLIPRLPLEIQVVHCNDWQTGLIPAYLKTELRDTPPYDSIASLLTIHNMGYQGRFWHWDMELTGLDWKYFNWRQMEFHHDLNLLKTGIVFADSINTVSSTYAAEIQNEPQGSGLSAALRERSDVLSGILNGVNYEQWNPETDPNLVENYNASKCKDARTACKLAVQREVGLPESPTTPLLGLVGRLAEQKGWDLIIDVMRRWVTTMDAQWVVLGTGQRSYQESLRDLASGYPHRVAAELTFSDPLAHRIEAGADMFVMPSRYEPCGLNQLYSLKYGAVPIVHRTGGLADTITGATPHNLDDGVANGFSFTTFDTNSLEQSLLAACDVYWNKKKVWRQLIRTGMKQDWSWTKSAQQYLELYELTQQRQHENRLSVK